MILLWYAILTTIFWVFTSIYLQISRRKIQFLTDLSKDIPNPEPAVAIIIAVRNEEADLEKALQSICRLRYPNCRILVVNDRSTDRTPEILRELSEIYPKISVLNIEELPPGWLGKNHALYSGYTKTSEEWMLFTDADVVFAPDTLNKAMHYVLQNRLDFLTVLPEIKSRSWVLVSVIATFKLMLELKLRPWDARKPKSIAYIGVGAFNLVKRQAYEKAGTHKPIALRPDDDLKLGEILKKAGFRLDVLYGDKQIELEWYTSIREFIKGLMKNTFAVSNYSLLFAIAAALATLIAFVLPVPLFILFGNAPERWMALIIFVFQVPLFLPRKSMNGKWWDVLMMPVAGLLIVYVILKSTYLTLKQGGIYWRDTFYSLSELRKNK